MNTNASSSGEPTLETMGKDDRRNRFTTAYPPRAHERAISRIMQHVCGVIALQNDFQLSTVNSLAILSDLGLIYMNEMCRLAKLYCDHAGRALPIEADLVLALRNLGMTEEQLIEEIIRLCKRPNMINLQVRVANPPHQQQSLKIAEPVARPNHIPSFLPPFPEPHTYIETSVSCEPDISYTKHREACAEFQEKVDMSLINYWLTKYPSICVFREYDQRIRNEACEQLKESQKARQLRRQRIELEVRDDPGSETSRVMLNGMAANTVEFTAEQNDDNGVSAELMDVDNESSTENRTSVVQDEELVRRSNGTTSTTIDETVLEDEGRTRQPNPELEELLEWQETEHSIVRRHLKVHHQILLLFNDPRPYLAALLPADALEELPD